jgi:hypothetical protein
MVLNNPIAKRRFISLENKLSSLRRFDRTEGFVMSETFNPFGAPDSTFEDVGPQLGFEAKNAWRYRKHLMVARDGATLPTICFVTGHPDSVAYVERRFSGPCRDVIGGVDRSLDVGGRVIRVRLPIADRILWQRRFVLAVVWTLALAIMPLLVVGIWYVNPPDQARAANADVVGDNIALIVAGTTLIAIASAWFLQSYWTMFEIVRLGAEHVVLKGGHTEFLAALPEWPDPTRKPA